MEAQYFHSNLIKSDLRITQNQTEEDCLLNKNEQPSDTHSQLKSKVTELLKSSAWNRYPTIKHSEIEKALGVYCKMNHEQIVIAPGASSIIVSLLNYFALNKKQIIIPQPTYSFFNYHCNTYNIPFEPWYLNNDLKYTDQNLPKLSNNSVLFIVSPNNPVGNIIPEELLNKLLIKNPQTLFVLDAVYQEFSTQNFNHLINKYSNLIIIRSFSKAFPAAGIRLGYFYSNKSIINNLRKLILPYSISHFALLYAKCLLQDIVLLNTELNKINKIILQREFIHSMLIKKYKNTYFTIIPSEGNFLLLKFHNNVNFNKLLKVLDINRLKILNTSGQHLLENSLRLTIGNELEMNNFLSCLQQTY